MLKLSASYSKKVPAEQEYSSKSYHVALEVELPTGLDANALQAKIRETFELARNSVESEIHSGQVIGAPPAPVKSLPSAKQDNNTPASPRQIKFLTDLIQMSGYSINQYLQHYQIQSLRELSKSQCSSLIDELQKGAA